MHVIFNITDAEGLLNLQNLCNVQTDIGYHLIVIIYDNKVKY